MLEHGPRGLDYLVPAEPDIPPEEVDNYGIDWDEIENPGLMEHFFEHNHAESLDSDQGVVVEAPDIPLAADLENAIQQELLHRGVSLVSRDMLVRRRIWEVGLEILEQFGHG
ncbi:hypothetical protein FRC08_002756 [Ceratobasidium sp. 394]|nr:hypothetical protein FRC08_002756 [Ceratobasidium sp. 394]